MLNFVLCDDNSNFLNSLDKTLNKLILKNDFNAKIGFKSTKISEVLDYINSNKTDVLFLDIHLNSSENGLNVAEKIRKANKDIYFIFTTRTFRIYFFSFSS
ncbi:MAG: response regulator [Clostridia bacterium]|nr:response regulator [Clostridia bacterium]